HPEVPLSSVEQDLASDDPDVRAKAALSLGFRREVPLPLLERALDDRDARVRASATRALAGARDRAGPLLDRALRDPDPLVRKEAVEVRGSGGDSAARRQLSRAVTDEDRSVRIAASQRLAEVGDVRHALPGLAEGLRSDDESDRQHAVDQLVGATKDLGSDADSAIPALVEALGDEKVSTSAALALANIGPDAAAPLIEALHSPSPTTRKSARFTLVYPLAPK